MLDGSHFFECKCASDEHTMRFVLDKEDVEIYVSQFLDPWHPWWKRVWLGIRYAFGYQCKYGYWDGTILKDEDSKRLRDLCNEMIALQK